MESWVGYKNFVWVVEVRVKFDKILEISCSIGGLFSLDQSIVYSIRIIFDWLGRFCEQGGLVRFIRLGFGEVYGRFVWVKILDVLKFFMIVFIKGIFLNKVVFIIFIDG